MTTFSRDFVVSWGHLDGNGHMANTAYLDLAADTRLMYFASHGFPASRFRELGFGPVVRKDEVEYFRELLLHETVTVTLAFAALSDDGARFTVCNEFRRGDELAARVTSTGGWLDLRARRLAPPPEALREAMRAAPRTDEFRAS